MPRCFTESHTSCGGGEGEACLPVCTWAMPSPTLDFKAVWGLVPGPLPPGLCLLWSSGPLPPPSLPRLVPMGRPGFLLTGSVSSIASEVRACPSPAVPLRQGLSAGGDCVSRGHHDPGEGAAAPVWEVEAGGASDRVLCTGQSYHIRKACSSLCGCLAPSALSPEPSACPNLSSRREAAAFPQPQL